MKIHELLSDESKWCRRECALDSDGIPVEPRSNEASKWCLVGAAHRCYNPNCSTGAQAMTVLELIETTLKAEHVSHWNDAPERTFAEVRDLCIKLDI